MSERQPPPQFNIPEKANRILNVILITMLLLVIRIWHLSVVQYESRLEQSKKPQRRVVVEAARRATIRDRFGIPLAINKIQYNAAVLYSQFRQIPAVAWTKDKSGSRIKVNKRKEYINKLAHVLGEELDLNPERLEDLIHAKALFYYHVPFVIKEDISEKEYYRLKMLEKDWVGIQVQRLPKRSYPMGKVGADIIGYMGAINRQEYDSVIGQIKVLEDNLKKYEEGGLLDLPEGMDSPAQARKRLKELLERAYTVNDYVGKSGIEGRFEEDLRGFQGKKSYYSDARGNFLRELPGSREPVAGKQLVLTISSELQGFSEEILIQNEAVRTAHFSKGESGQPVLAPLQPWIKGGAIVAMDPHNGEILAMASHPRFDPNDFIASGNPEVSVTKQANILRWFETEDYLGQVWDQKRPFEKEVYAPGIGIVEHSQQMTWEVFLGFILPPQHFVRSALEKVGTIKDAVSLLKAISDMLACSGQSDPYWLFSVLYENEGHQSFGKRVPAEVRLALKHNLDWQEQEVAKLRGVLDGYLSQLSSDYDKVLLIDLCRLIVNEGRFSEELLRSVGSQSLSSHREVSSAAAKLGPFVRSITKDLFHEIHFKEWKNQNLKDFLKQKRAEEKASGKYPRPYIDYIDQMENQLFVDFWNRNRWALMEAFLLGNSNPEQDLREYFTVFTQWHEELNRGAHSSVPWRKAYDTLQITVSSLPPSLVVLYMQTLRTFNDLNRPLLGYYRHLRKRRGVQLEKDLATAYYPAYGFGYGRSYAFRQASTQGSIFKLAVAYAALAQKYQELGKENITKKKLNPLEITDVAEHHGKEKVVGYHLDGRPIPQLYKGGRLPKSSAREIGKVDVIRAIETSSNPYFALLAGDFLDSPEVLVQTAKSFSFGSKTGIDLPAEISGKVPDDLNTNRTGLYATAIGQHSLVVTPLQSSVMLSAIANGGQILKPQIVRMCIETKGGISLNSRNFPYKDYLASVGIDFPLFTTVASQNNDKIINRSRQEICRTLFMPEIIRSMLLDGMNRVVKRISQPSLTPLSRMYKNHPEAISDFLEVQDTIVGKSSTAEALEHIGLDLNQSTEMYTHIWFGGISFDSDSKEEQAFLFRDAYGRPELIVVVYLRFGKFGKEAAPIAAQVIKKWREIKSKEEQ